MIYTIRSLKIHPYLQSSALSLEVRWLKRLTVARMWSSDLVQTSVFGLVLVWLMEP